MKIISPKIHGIIDYLTSLFLFAAPTLFEMEGSLCTFTYTLAVIHLLLTALTNFEPGIIRVIPFRIHGLIEIIVSVGLIAASFWFNSNANEFGFYFCMTLAIAILIIFLLTNFKESKTPVTF